MNFLGNKKRKNKGKPKKQIIDNSVQPSKIETPKFDNNHKPTKTSNPVKEKEPWYNSGLIWGIIGLVTFILSILISNYFGDKSTALILENSNQNKEEIIDSSKSYNENIIQQLQPQLKQFMTNEDYQRDMEALNRKSEEDKKIQDAKTRAMIDSMLSEKYNIVLRNINYISGSKWSELFNGDYAIFKIGTESKLYISQGSFKSPFQISWNELKLRYTSKDAISFEMPTLLNKKSNLKLTGMGFQISRGFNYLNRIYRISSLGGNMYAGIIADNNEGIIGIIGYSEKLIDSQKENLIDFNSLQKLTNIDFYSNNNQKNIN